ncbi:uncharacterized protein LOC133909930 [Phragmites australis]|uniref:uncharacterized protein LOC133909930 n=1 Tax=Phragmites australis TaxID=29695 RepID=UPI002D79F281|nr:uncharacterized protein LOC133909930 [Phragmites australis]
MPEPPEELRLLYTSGDPESQHFRDSIRFFNGHFSFTTLYCDYDKELANARDGVYTFKAHGKMYHNIYSFGQRDDDPSHLQLYFYDDDPSLSHRFRRARDEAYRARDRSVIRSLVGMLRDNPYSETFRSLGQVEDMDEYRIVLNIEYKLDQRVYNMPLTSEVVAVWVEGSELHKHFDRSITLFANNDTYYSIRPHHGCYDPLSYPLLFPSGELGWHPEIPKQGVDIRQIRRSQSINPDNPDTNSTLCVTMCEYYCYKFQMRHGMFNTILHGKRLFQQFAVDTYIKLETSRLNYILHNQSRIRADLYQGLVDMVSAGENRASAMGKRWVLPASFIGGPRDMRR